MHKHGGRMLIILCSYPALTAAATAAATTAALLLLVQAQPDHRFIRVCVLSRVCESALHRGVGQGERFREKPGHVERRRRGGHQGVLSACGHRGTLGCRPRPRH